MSKRINEYITYLSPEFIYVPFDKVELLSLSKNGKVFNNLFLGKMENGNNIFSPISGKIIGTKKMRINNDEKNCLVIENDFIDRRCKLNPSINISKVKKNEIKDRLDKYNLNKKIDSKTVLVVESKYDKNYDLCDMVVNYESYDDILEAIDEFMDIFGMKSCYICIDKNDIYSTSSYEKYINAFLNICIVDSNKKFKNDKCIFYSVEEILAIYKAIHQDYMYDTTYVTIFDKESIVVKVKLYTSLLELLKALKISYSNKKIYINFKEVNNITDFIIDSSIRSIVLRDKK